jgi:hypothetical protein
MKNKFLLVALIGVLMAVGMVLVSCGVSCDGCSLAAGTTSEQGIPSPGALKIASNCTEQGKGSNCAVQKANGAVSTAATSCDCN